MSNDKNKLDFSLVLASSVHDMKNSLGMLLNSLENLIRDNPPTNDDQAKQFATLQYETSRINNELIQLLSIYRLEHDRLPLNIDAYFVADMLEEQLARNDMLFSTRGIDVTVVCDDALNWYFDNELVGGVVHNVLANSARYGDKELKVSADVVDGVLCICIEDDGEGYPAAMIKAPEEIMAGVSFTSGSTKLGLFFAAEVARMHCQKDVCGYIKLENGGSLGGGVFKLYLP